MSIDNHQEEFSQIMVQHGQGGHGPNAVWAIPRGEVEQLLETFDGIGIVHSF